MAQFHRTFHSLQIDFTRRFRNGFSFGVNDTWTLYDKGNTGLPGPQLRLVHAADGSYSVSPDQADRRGAVRRSGHDDAHHRPPTSSGTCRTAEVREQGHDGHRLRRQRLAAVRASSAATPAAVRRRLQLQQRRHGPGPDGIAGLHARASSSRTSARSGRAARATSTRSSTTRWCRATGGASPFTSTAIAGPQVGSHGLESGRNLLHGCKDHTHRPGDSAQDPRRRRQDRSVFRADMYNAFNDGRLSTAGQTQLQFNSTTDQTVRNSQFLADGTIDPPASQPNQAGFGAANGAPALRTIQLQTSSSSRTARRHYTRERVGTSHPLFFAPCWFFHM